MLNTSCRFTAIIVLITVFVSCTGKMHPVSPGLPPYSPASQQLHDTIARLDSLFFDAYNHCKTGVFENLLSDDIEFYHDQGGLNTSKSELMQALKNNICGKVTRELLAGSIEVYPIPNFGAVQIGAHRFFNNQEAERGPSRFSRFVHIWRLEHGKWRLTRVISLH